LQLPCKVRKKRRGAARFSDCIPARSFLPRPVFSFFSSFCRSGPPALRVEKKKPQKMSTRPRRHAPLARINDKHKQNHQTTARHSRSTATCTCACACGCAVCISPAASLSAPTPYL
jgi:hypothetical protein